MVCARQGSVADTISIHVFVTGKISQTIQVFLGQHFAALNWLFRIFKGIGHPVVHSQIKVGHYEYERLETLRQIKRILRHGEALFRGTWNQKNVFGVAMGKKCIEKDVALRSARGQTSRRTDSLDVPDHPGTSA